MCVSVCVRAGARRETGKTYARFVRYFLSSPPHFQIVRYRFSMSRGVTLAACRTTRRASIRNTDVSADYGTEATEHSLTTSDH